ncbi:MAG TPA: ABC transporter ATP-binding protein [Chthonomonas sp.]|uniref:ABC transporter ATP-binding protein n=1 Tax=Chthonomonas sp. TaxID=2282153 RepID=UPI002B4B664A|nr:ABC transporter ATP-binding protein [Chthonomonas sp.]HLI47703.1 ABC transporter ATP-binding protein [Chthonomonas sp.]
MSQSPLLQVRGLKKHFSTLQRADGRWRRAWIRAVDGVDLSIAKGETLGLVGESGCGKSTVGRALLRLIEPDEGEIRFLEQDVRSLKGESLRRLRREIGLVFQDPFAAFNPRLLVGDIVAEPLLAHRLVDTKAERFARVCQLLESVGLPSSAAERYPHEFSGGQRQRIGIARAIATRPQLLVLDEPTSALDLSIRAQVLNLLLDLQESLGMAYLLISHDLTMVGHFAHRVAVMYLGVIVEEGPTEAIFQSPLHPYTQMLLAAAPRPDPSRRSARKLLEGEPPSPIEVPGGCRFRTRCPFAKDRCAQEVPVLREIKTGHKAACHYAGALNGLQ